jgi:hypothetical protein
MQKPSCSKCTADELCPKCLSKTDVVGGESEEESVESDDSSDSDEESEESVEKNEDIDKEEDLEEEKEEIVEDARDTVDSVIYDPSIDAESNSRINRRIIVAPEKRITSNMLTQLELARAIAIRAANIDAKGHDNAFVDIKDCDNAGKIAKKELYSRRSPLVLYRSVGMNHWEKFAIREMAFP